MISFNSSLQSCVAARCNALLIIGDFDQPEYHIGQLVWHCIKRPTGETLYPVQIVGICWSGLYWEYCVVLPEHHPWFQFNDSDYEWVSSDVLEAM